jgi:cell wall-associated NlpC family hydrolase
VPSRAWSAAQVQQALEHAAATWHGVPYRLGGTSRYGVDCSALVQQVFASHFSITLPRATADQVRIGTRVDPASLQPGDILFFRPANGVRHSGIYLSEGRFLHASASSGVRVSTLDTAYWTQRWWQARRVLPALAPPAAAPPAPVMPAADRRGW